MTLLTKTKKISSSKILAKELLKHREHYLLLIIPISFILLFNYAPMYGVIIAFKDFNLRLGIVDSPWLDPWYGHFQDFFLSTDFTRILRNTLVISTLKIFLAFPVPIIFALLLTEIKSLKFRKLTQTVSYLPHFISWVILSAVFIDILSLDGIINSINKLLGLPTVIYMSKSNYFWGIVTATHIWKTFGWASIIYFAAIAGIDKSLYEAAVIDGAGRFRQTISITLPCITPTIIILMVLNMGNVLNAGFDQIFNMYNMAVMDVANIIDTYVYQKGLIESRYDYSTAVGLFKSLIGFIMIVSFNKIASHVDEGSSLW